MENLGFLVAMFAIPFGFAFVLFFLSVCFPHDYRP